MSSASKVKALKTTRGVDIKLRYSLDEGGEGLVNQRQYFDDSGSLLTPITPALLVRQVLSMNSPGLEKVGKVEPRYVMVCFASPTNLSGESNFKVLIPYAPGDASQSEQIKEIRDYVSASSFLVPPSPLALMYQGENHIP